MEVDENGDLLTASRNLQPRLRFIRQGKYPQTRKTGGRHASIATGPANPIIVTVVDACRAPVDERMEDGARFGTKAALECIGQVVSERVAVIS